MASRDLVVQAFAADIRRSREYLANCEMDGKPLNQWGDAELRERLAKHNAPATFQWPDNGSADRGEKFMLDNLDTIERLALQPRSTVEGAIVRIIAGEWLADMSCKLSHRLGRAMEEELASRSQNAT